MDFLSNQGKSREVSPIFFILSKETTPTPKGNFILLCKSGGEVLQFSGFWRVLTGKNSLLKGEKPNSRINLSWERDE